MSMDPPTPFYLRLSLSSFADGRPCLGFHLARALGFALIVQLLAFCYRDLYFDMTAFQIHLCGNQGQPFFTRFSQQFVDLFSVKQQFAPPRRWMVLPITV